MMRNLNNLSSSSTKQVKLEDNTVMTAKQIQGLQKRNAQLEEENLILKKESAIFMQNSK